MKRIEAIRELQNVSDPGMYAIRMVSHVDFLLELADEAAEIIELLETALKGEDRRILRDWLTKYNSEVKE